VVLAQVSRLEAGLLLEVAEGDGLVAEEDQHADRLVLFLVAVAMDERLVGADRGPDEHSSAGRGLQRTAVGDAEGQLDESAGLTEKDVGVDARERCLAELGDGRLLAVARFDLGAQSGQFRAVAGVRTSTRNRVQGAALLVQGQIAFFNETRTARLYCMMALRA
jgi:hypothetical protein